MVHHSLFWGIIEGLDGKVVWHHFCSKVVDWGNFKLANVVVFVNEWRHADVRVLHSSVEKVVGVCWDYDRILLESKQVDRLFSNFCIVYDGGIVNCFFEGLWGKKLGIYQVLDWILDGFCRGIRCISDCTGRKALVDGTKADPHRNLEWTFLCTESTLQIVMNVCYVAKDLIDWGSTIHLVECVIEGWIEIFWAEGIVDKRLDS